jgi:hypothetical protein
MKGQIIEKVVEHDAKGRITKIVERDVTPESKATDPATLLELEAASATLHALEGLARHALAVLEHPESPAKTKTQPMTVTIGPFGGGASYAVKSHAIGKRLESSAIFKVLCATARWPKVDITLTPSPTTDAVARPQRAAVITPTRHVGFRASGD